MWLNWVTEGNIELQPWRLKWKDCETVLQMYWIWTKPLRLEVVWVTLLEKMQQQRIKHLLLGPVLLQGNFSFPLELRGFYPIFINCLDVLIFKLCGSEWVYADYSKTFHNYIQWLSSVLGLVGWNGCESGDDVVMGVTWRCWQWTRVAEGSSLQQRTCIFWGGAKSALLKRPSPSYHCLTRTSGKLFMHYPVVYLCLNWIVVRVQVCIFEIWTRWEVSSNSVTTGNLVTAGRTHTSKCPNLPKSPGEVYCGDGFAGSFLAITDYFSLLHSSPNYEVDYMLHCIIWAMQHLTFCW